jgi:hypothetical protein
VVKIFENRYNPDEIWIYYPSHVLDNPCIRIKTKHGLEEDVVFTTEEERDRHLKAMDKAFLTVKDGEVIDNNPIPFFPEGGEFGGPGGMPMQ